jgi:hypothetical protein
MELTTHVQLVSRHAHTAYCIAQGNKAEHNELIVLQAYIKSAKIVLRTMQFTLNLPWPTLIVFQQVTHTQLHFSVNSLQRNQTDIFTYTGPPLRYVTAQHDTRVDYAVISSVGCSKKYKFPV